MALHIGGIPFKDDRFQFSDFDKIKESGELPFNQVPIMIVDGQVISQSVALLRYCGKLAGLYPRDEEEDLYAARIDEVIDVLLDIINYAYKYRGPDKEKLKEVREEFVRDVVPRFVGGLDRLTSKASEGKYICGDKLSIADLVLYYTIWNIKNGNCEFVPTDLFEKYPRLMSSFNAVETHPKVVEWNAAHPVKHM